MAETNSSEHRVAKRADSAHRLPENEQQFRQMADSLPLILWVHGPEGQPEFINRTYRQFFGVDLADLSIGSWRRKIHPDDVEDYSKAYDESLRARAEFHAEARFRTHDGRWRWLESWARPRFRDDGTFAGLVGTSADVTDRKQAEQTKSNAEQFARRAFNSVANFVGVLTPDGILIDVNEPALAVGDLSRDNVLGQPFWETFWWNYSPKIQAQLRESIDRARAGEILRYDVPVQISGAGRMWIDFQLAPLRNDAGDITHLIPSGMDITARYLAEERLKIAQEASTVGIFDYDVIGDELRWDEHSARIWGVGQNSVLNYEDFRSGLHPDDRTPTDAAVKRSMSPDSDGHYFAEYRVIHKSDGIMRWVAAYGRTFFEDGRPVRIVGTTQDITARKFQEVALSESEERFRLAADAVGGIIYEYDLGEGTAHRSSGLTEVLGFSPDEVPNTIDWWQQRVHPQDVPTFLQVLNNNESSERSETEYRIQHRDGSWVQVWDRSLVVFNQMGIPTKIFGSVVDITDLRQVEQQLKELNERLEELVSVRTAELKNRNEQLKKLAAELCTAEMRERDRLSQVLHDGLQQLLVAIKMHLTILENAAGSDADRVRSDLKAFIDEAIQSSRSLAHELSPPELNDDSLPEAMQWLASRFQSHYHFNVDVTCDEEHTAIPPEERLLLLSTIRELLLNAVKHSGTDRAAIHLSNGDDHRSITVEDKGKGFDPRIVEYGGEAGLGLRSVQQRIVAFGGAFEIDSAPGRGTKFLIRTPLKL
ncbi:PAS domain-containing sensor histidine kinase [Stratiformator vulcanicus]|uniref:Oxygen sensor histidine kinase NreB n=1 Tax=Stratiformator vulcanicus TaxID=2527980 RepID=A0A517R2L3_9PLAN|nr:PAS domain-containing sensor histidine kinase [Stratiformator vulcanicus]QDT38094.1 Sensor histidine kinase TodS [Stratiformator vulcanicus]